ncbi:MAG: hypothetical protein U1F81_14925 [Verrucomicrobiaceae bacterium]
MTGAGVSIPWPEDGVGLLQAEWSRLGITGWIAVTPTQDGTARLGLTTESSAWMPGFDTLQLAQTLKLDVQHSDDDLLREIWLCLLHSPVLVTYPSAAELLSSVRIRRNISRHAVKTRLNFNTTAIERPEDCWTYSEDTGFILKPGCDLIESLIKASQPPPGGIAYSFSCYRASEYVVLLGLAQEAREVHPALYARLQKQWHTHAVASRRFHDVFMEELGTVEQPLPIHYYVPGDRVWFRNPDTLSDEVEGFEGSWVVYLGGGLFANFWKRDRPFDVLGKCLEIYHWRHGTYRDAKGELLMDENVVERLVAETRADPKACAEIFERMHRMRDPLDVYAGGGCMDATREYPKFILPPHSEMIAALDALEW